MNIFRAAKHIKSACFLFFLLFAFNEICLSQAISQYTVNSPDGGTRLEIGLDIKCRLMYRVFYMKKEVTTWSVLGFQFNNIIAGNNTIFLGSQPSTHNEIFKWPLGEDDRIENNYSELILSCESMKEA